MSPRQPPCIPLHAYGELLVIQDESILGTIHSISVEPAIKSTDLNRDTSVHHILKPLTHPPVYMYKR